MYLYLEKKKSLCLRRPISKNCIHIKSIYVKFIKNNDTAEMVTMCNKDNYTNFRNTNHGFRCYKSRWAKYTIRITCDGKNTVEKTVYEIICD